MQSNQKVKIKHIEKSKYKYVNLYLFPDIGEKWVAQIPRLGWSKTFHSEKEAAIAVDVKMLEVGKVPVNVLIKKE